MFNLIPWRDEVCSKANYAISSFSLAAFSVVAAAGGGTS